METNKTVDSKGWLFFQRNLTIWTGEKAMDTQDWSGKEKRSNLEDIHMDRKTKKIMTKVVMDLLCPRKALV